MQDIPKRVKLSKTGIRKFSRIKYIFLKNIEKIKNGTKLIKSNWSFSSVFYL